MNRVVILLSLVCATALGCQPILRVYNDNEDGEIRKDMIFVQNVPDLTKNFTTERMYTCPEGIWMAYRNEHYGGAEGERYIITGPRDGIFSCHFEGEGRERRIIRSAKVLGDPADYTSNAVVAYPRTNNEGADLTYLEDAPKANATFQSMILVGPLEVEIFTEEDFEGDSYCVTPNSGDVGKAEEIQRQRRLQDGDEMYTNVRDLAATFGTAEFKSFRFGCGEMRKKLL